MNHLLTGVRCRATSVAKKFYSNCQQDRFCHKVNEAVLFANALALRSHNSPLPSYIQVGIWWVPLDNDS